MSKPITVRWLVRQELVREPRFGETKRDVLRWTVRQYLRLDGNRRIHTFSAPTYYRSLAAAIEEARRRCAERYGCKNHDHTRRSR